MEILLLICAPLHAVRSQEIQFTNVPETITEGTDDLIIFWTGGTPGTSWTVQLVQDGRVIDDDVDDDDGDDGGAQSFEWDVDLEDNPGGYYSLRLIQGTQTADSRPINIIDEDGRGATTPPPSASTSGSASGSAPSSAPAAPMDAIGSASGSIAATATTLVTTVIAGTTITAEPETAAPTGNNNTNTTDDAGGGGGLSGGAIAGIVIGIIGFLTLIGLLIFLVRRRTRNSRRAHTMPFTGRDEKSTADPEYTTPAAFAGMLRSGTAAMGNNKAVKPELHAEDKPLRTKPGVHEMYSPEISTNALSGPYEMQSPGGSHNEDRGLINTRSDALRTQHSGENRSSISEVVGSSTDASLSSVSPPKKHAIPRKKIGGNGCQGQRDAQPSTIDELG